jgi:hypothetical protein
MGRDAVQCDATSLQQLGSALQVRLGEDVERVGLGPLRDPVQGLREIGGGVVGHGYSPAS